MRKSILVVLVVVVAIFSYKAGSSFAEDGSDSSKAPVYAYRVVNSFPHDPEAFTQGLVYHDGFLYEGTGLYGKSSLRKVSLEEGTVVKEKELLGSYFGEGITLFDGVIVQLTYREKTGFVYDEQSWRLLKTFSYSSQGWGLTQNGDHLIMSDGSEVLTFLDPSTFAPIKKVLVLCNGQPVRRLNELEYVNGEVYANVWHSNRIARINPDTGQVTSWIDLSGLVRDVKAEHQTANVLNGIAFDAEKERLFVTGKHWPAVFEVELVPVTN